MSGSSRGRTAFMEVNHGLGRQQAPLDSARRTSGRLSYPGARPGNRLLARDSQTDQARTSCFIVGTMKRGNRAGRDAAMIGESVAVGAQSTVAGDPKLSMRDRR
jgi:hypothetical protein